MTRATIRGIGIFGQLKKDEMANQSVVILGCTGMLGSMTLDTFARDDEFDIIATFRDPNAAKALKKKYPKVRLRKLDAEKANIKAIANAIYDAKWVVNAIGVIKPFIRDDNAQEIHRAIHVNARFPHLLVQAAEDTGTKIIQIATDCVYSGTKGRYVETDAHDALDVYGKTKSLGEVFNNQIYHLRCSIIGPELKGHKSLLDWFLSQPKGARVNGFTNHQWNGITSLHFAKLCQGIINKKPTLPRIQHIIPGNKISKAELLKSFAKEFDRKDITINDVKAPNVIDRTLSTNNAKLNNEIWRAVGYNTPPTIREMIKELANYSFVEKVNEI
jgi:dTDP-4-dehydrorhamnose reductase